MNDTDALLAAILLQPGEDTPRLAFADHLDELGGPTNAARAEFIRTQIELYRLGPPHTRIEGPVSRKRTNVWMVEADATDIRLGHRVDLVPLNRLRDLNAIRECGLLVTKINVLNPFTGQAEIHLTKDEYSRPYPADRQKKLHSRCRAMIREWGNGSFLLGRPPNWDFHMPADHNGAFQLTSPENDFIVDLERGFPSAFNGDSHIWEREAEGLIATVPIARVAFRDELGLHTEAATKGKPSPVRFALATLEPDAFTEAKSVVLSYREWEALGAGYAECDLAVVLRLLRKRWPTVTEWDAMTNWAVR